MTRIIRRGLFLIVAVCFLSKAALAVPIGYVSWNVSIPGSAGSFDITNQTGVNHSIFPDATWPIVTSIHLTGLALAVDFVGGGHTNFASSYFTLSGDGISFDGGLIPAGGSNPLPSRAVLTGSFTPLTLLLNDGTSKLILSSFTSTIPLTASGLNDGEFGIIDATISTTAVAPEPSSILLLGFGIAALVLIRKQQGASAPDVL